MGSERHAIGLRSPTCSSRLDLRLNDVLAEADYLSVTFRVCLPRYVRLRMTWYKIASVATIVAGSTYCQIISCRTLRNMHQKDVLICPERFASFIKCI